MLKYFMVLPDKFYTVQFIDFPPTEFVGPILVLIWTPFTSIDVIGFEISYGSEQLQKQTSDRMTATRNFFIIDCKLNDWNLLVFEYIIWTKLMSKEDVEPTNTSKKGNSNCPPR